MLKKAQQVAAADRPKRWRVLGSLRGLRPLRRRLSFGVMRKTNNEIEWDQRFFNRAVNSAELALEKGYPQAWFKWIEWVALTSLLFIAFDKTHSFILLLLALLSCITLFFIALVAIDRLIADIKGIDKVRPIYRMVGALAVAFCTPWVVWRLIDGILHASGSV